MSPFDLREPVSALTHGLGLLAAAPTSWFLLRATRKRLATTPDAVAFERGKAAGLALFGIGMIACYGASTLYHAWTGSEQTIELLRRIDMVGIFLLIAGTFTPSAWALMRPRPRRLAITVVWSVSAACGSTFMIGRPLPTWLATSVYLALGWGMILCYVDIRRAYSRQTLKLLPIGGVLYSLGAAVNLNPAPGCHEIFHLLVLAGTASHVAFLFQVVIPAPQSHAPNFVAPSSLAPWERRGERVGSDSRTGQPRRAASRATV